MVRHLSSKPLLAIMTAGLLHAVPSDGKAAIRVLALGDSLTEGYGIARSRAFPAVLEQMLRTNGHPQIEIINAGISGSTSVTGLPRLRRYLEPPPEVLILALGINDGLRGAPISEIRRNLSDCI